jgi:hypothetical protein
MNRRWRKAHALSFALSFEHVQNHEHHPPSFIIELLMRRGDDEEEETEGTCPELD